MRQVRNLPKHAAKQNHRRGRKCKSTDGPVCPHCEPHINGRLKRQQAKDQAHAQEIILGYD